MPGTTSSTPAIRIDDLTHRFGDTVAVDHLSLTVDRGEVFGFLGHNGAGKTTTIRLLNGVFTPASGEIRVLGFDPRTDGPALRAKTGVLTETPALDERLSAIDNLTFAADLFGVPPGKVRGRVEEALGSFGLADRATERVGGYSKGMKQRLALARAFLHEPDLVFLDEPTAALDPVAIQDVHRLIHRVSRDQGRTVFLCTHNLAEAERLCDRVGVVERGRLVALGSPSELARTSGAAIRYRIEVPAEQLEPARALIGRMPAVQGCDLDAGELIATLDDREAVPAVLSALLGAGVRVYAATPRHPSLEDIYLALHRREGRAR